MPRLYTGRDVFDEAVHRMVLVYEAGHRVVVSFSGGKDSGVCLEVCLEAARQTGRLPVEVIMRDEEIMFPGTFEYAERVASRKDVQFHWIYACQPIINCFNRAAPYWWVFDPALPPEAWVRRPPSFAYRITEMDISRMTTPDRFPPDPGRQLFAVIGLRVVESRGRRYGVHSSGGYLTKPNRYGTRNCRPIFDWEDGDVWRAIHVNGWDYNTAYNTLFRLGAPSKFLRIAPPTMAAAGVPNLQLAARAWPLWFERVCKRLDGVRAAANYGMRAVKPQRRLDESWEDCFDRVCIREAPAWIQERAGKARPARPALKRPAPGDPAVLHLLREHRMLEKADGSVLLGGPVRDALPFQPVRRPVRRAGVLPAGLREMGRIPGFRVRAP